MSLGTKTNVLLNAAPLCTVLSGVARYTRSLYTAIQKQQLADVGYFCNGRFQETMPAQSGSPKGGKLPCWIREILREIRFKFIQKKIKTIVNNRSFDVYHETGAFPLLKNKDLPTVMTIYDLSLVKFKHCHPVDRVRLFERYFYKRIDDVEHFITISEFIRQEIIETFNIPPEKVTAIPLAAEKHFMQKPQNEASRYTLNKNLPERYILTVGTHEPRKNIATLVKALARTKEKYTLVSTGWSGWLNSEFHQEIRNLGMEERIVCLGHVPDEELVLLYNGASLMVYPSLYEGFGLPILEAMACACPVICSNTSSMPEVAGDAAILISPEDVDGMAKAIDDILQNESLAQQLVKKGIARASEFSWDITARETMSIFERVSPGRV